VEAVVREQPAQGCSRTRVSTWAREDMHLGTSLRRQNGRQGTLSEMTAAWNAAKADALPEHVQIELLYQYTCILCD